MGKKTTLYQKIENKLKDNRELIHGYVDELKKLEAERGSGKFTQGELNHLTRLILNNTSDLLYYFYEYFKLPKDIRTSGSLDVITLRCGDPEMAKELYKKQIEKNSKSVKKAFSNMTEDEYKRKMPQFIEFYLERYDEKTAREKFNEYLRKRSKISKKAVIKSNEYRKNNQESNNTRIKHYLKKYNGDYELAEAALKARQATNSLENYIRRLGSEEGYNAWRKRQRDWQNTLKSRPIEEQDKTNRLKVNRGFSNNVSKSSIKFFDRLQKDIEYDLQYGSKGEEFSILKEDKIHRYYYDCFIRELGIIIEFHGTAFHPKPMDYNWTGYLNKFNYREARLKDLRKRKLAVDNGYQYIEVWDDVPYYQSLQKIRRVINGRIT